MPTPGGIISRKAGPKPELQLPFAMRGAEPIFRWLMDTAEDTKQVQLELLDVLKEIRDQDANGHVHGALQAIREITASERDLLGLIAKSIEEILDIAKPAPLSEPPTPDAVEPEQKQASPEPGRTGEEGGA